MRIDVYHHFPEKLLIVKTDQGQLSMKGGIKIMYIVKDTNPDVGYQLVLGDVTDAEGNVIPDAKVSVEVTSDNPAVVEVTPNAADGNKTGNVHFGGPGVATVTALVKAEDGTILASGAAPFTVTVGDPAAISGMTLKFEGLTEAPEPPIP